jgi:hypothetical protein
MRCFYHGDVEAVAVCKSCFRAICHDCCAQTESSTACRNRCETEVIAIDEQQHRSIRQSKAVGGLYYGLGTFCILAALLSLIGGLSSLRSKEPNLVAIFFGVVFLLGGLGCFRFARKAKK